MVSSAGDSGTVLETLVEGVHPQSDRKEEVDDLNVKEGDLVLIIDQNSPRGS